MIWFGILAGLGFVMMFLSMAYKIDNWWGYVGLVLIVVGFGSIIYLSEQKADNTEEECKTRGGTEIINDKCYDIGDPISLD